MDIFALCRDYVPFGQPFMTSGSSLIRRAVWRSSILEQFGNCRERINDMADQMKLNDRGLHVMTLAKDEAVRFNHNYIGSEHLLVGIIREEGTAAQILSELGITVEKARSALEHIMGRSDRLVIGNIWLTPRGKKIIELAAGEAANFSHASIGPEHILVGLVGEGEGIAAGIIESLGVNLERIKAALVKAFSEPNAQAEENAQGRLSWVEFVQGHVTDWYPWVNMDTNATRFHENPTRFIAQDAGRFYAELPSPTEQSRRITLLRNDLGYLRLLTEYFSEETPAERKAVLEETINMYRLSILLTGRPPAKGRWQSDDR